MGLRDKLTEASTYLRKLRLSRGPDSYYQYKWKREDKRKRTDRQHEQAKDDAERERGKAERERGYDERYTGERSRQVARERTQRGEETEPDL